MAYAKPYLTIPQQLALIQSRGMHMTDIDKAAHALERIGYYRLSGFWHPFRLRTVAVTGTTKVVTVSDDFRPQSNFEAVVDLYVFDKKMRLHFMDVFERIEIALRVQISLLLGKVSPWAHRDPFALHGNFSKKRNPTSGKTKHEVWLERTDAAFNESRAEFADHFRKKYPGDYPPIWIACEAWDFGAMSTLFNGLAKADQETIAIQYGITSFQIMESWLRCLNFARNCCAHHSRFWNRPLVIRPSWPSEIEAPKLFHIQSAGKALVRTYAVACLSKHMLDAINPTSSWGNRLKELCTAFPQNPAISLAAAGFPADWEKQPLWN